MQVMTLPPRWDGYPDHLHDANVDDAGQEEVYPAPGLGHPARRQRGIRAEAGHDHGPEATVEAREGIALAFITAMELLTPKQRVAVVLRDALGWSAREVADVLQDTVPAVNSALQRGRQRLEQERKEGTLARVHSPADARTEELVMRRFQQAWEAVDIKLHRRTARGRCHPDDATRSSTLRRQRTASWSSPSPANASPESPASRTNPTSSPGSDCLSNLRPTTDTEA